ncbi:lemA protein [alpha proteobacterium BAL199]|nr:lemA protein [alpha proteobacterium BAL199]
MDLFWIVPGLALVAALLGYGWYVSLIVRRNRAREALSSVDVQLRKRFDLIPNVLKLAQRYMDHEKGLLAEITALRARVQEPYSGQDPSAVAAHLDASRALEANLGRLFALAENYPDLKADGTIIRAQQTYEEVEGHISAARRFYNSAVGELNNAVEIFPGSVIAGWANVRAMPFYELDEPAARQPVSVDDVMR